MFLEITLQIRGMLSTKNVNIRKLWITTFGGLCLPLFRLYMAYVGWQATQQRAASSMSHSIENRQKFGLNRPASASQSINRKNPPGGSVSVPAETAETKGIAPPQNAHTDFTPSYMLWTFPAARLQMPNPVRWHKAENFIQAAGFARVIGKPLEYHLTVKYPTPDPYGLHHRRLKFHISEWLINNLGLSAFMWARETNGGDHSHFLLHLTPETKTRFRKMVVKWLKDDFGMTGLPAGAVQCRRAPLERVWSVTLEKFIKTRDQVIHRWVRYLLKSAPPDIRKVIGPQRKTDAGPSVGMRIGVSRCLNITARRKAGGVLPSGHRQVTSEMLEATDIRDRRRRDTKERWRQQHAA